MKLTADDLLHSKKTFVVETSYYYNLHCATWNAQQSSVTIGIMLFYDICAINTLCVGRDWFCTAAVPVVCPNHCSCYGELWVCILEKLSPSLLPIQGSSWTTLVHTVWQNACIGTAIYAQVMFVTEHACINHVKQDCIYIYSATYLAIFTDR